MTNLLRTINHVTESARIRVEQDATRKSRKKKDLSVKLPVCQFMVIDKGKDLSFITPGRFNKHRVAEKQLKVFDVCKRK